MQTSLTIEASNRFQRTHGRRVLPNRREVLYLTTSVIATGIATTSPRLAGAAADEQRSLAGLVGITTGGLNHQREHGELTVQTLPRFMRDELGMQLIDLNTRWLTSLGEDYLIKTRDTAQDAGCFFTNLKVNHTFGDLYSQDAREQARAMSNARQLVRAAKTLGARWIRFSVPQPTPTSNVAELAAHRRLAQYAQNRGLQLLVENNGWMRSDPNAVSQVVKLLGNNAAASPDTGNWNDDIRYGALAKSFPLAVTCDFKVFELDTQRRHAKYDIRRCFEIGWKANFRGPWAIEHWNQDTQAFVRDTVYLRDQLKQWMSDAG